METIKVSEKIEKMHKTKKTIFFNMYKMSLIPKDHIETKVGHSDLQVVTNKYEPKYKKRKFELVDEPKHQTFRRFIRNDLAEKLVKTIRADKIDAFRRSLGFNVINAFNTIEQIVLEVVKDAFEVEDTQTHYSVLGYGIDFYFHKHKLVIKVDELGHNDRNIEYEVERQKAITK